MSVTSGSDSGPGSLRQVIIDTPSGGVITISPSLALPIILESTIIIDKNLTIISYTNSVITAADTGVFDYHVFNCLGGSQVTFTGITFQGNSLFDNLGAVRSVAASREDGTSLTINQCLVDGWNNQNSPSIGNFAAVIAGRNVNMYSYDSIFSNNNVNFGPLFLGLGGTGFENALVNFVSNRCQVLNNTGSRIVHGVGNAGTSIPGSCNATISQCIMRGNNAPGTISFHAFGSGENSSVRVEDCLFEDNEGGSTVGFSASATFSPFSMTRNILRNNTSNANRVQIFAGGSAQANITNCIIDSNTSANGVVIRTNYNVLIENCTVSNNTASEVGTVELPSANGIEIFGNAEATVINTKY